MLALIVSIGGTIVGVINHRRIRSSCCGKKLEASIDIEHTTPQIKPAPVPNETRQSELPV